MGNNTASGACAMPQKQPQQSGPNVLPLGRTSGATTPSNPKITPAAVPPPSNTES
jgi:hypothetical protein